LRKETLGGPTSFTFECLIKSLKRSAKSTFTSLINIVLDDEGAVDEQPDRRVRDKEKDEQQRLMHNAWIFLKNKSQLEPLQKWERARGVMDGYRKNQLADEFSKNLKEKIVQLHKCERIFSEFLKIIKNVPAGRASAHASVELGGRRNAQGESCMPDQLKTHHELHSITHAHTTTTTDSKRRHRGVPPVLHRKSDRLR